MTTGKLISLKIYYSSLHVLVKLDESKETLVSLFSSLNLKLHFISYYVFKSRKNN